MFLDFRKTKEVDKCEYLFYYQYLVQDRLYIYNSILITVIRIKSNDNKFDKNMKSTKDETASFVLRFTQKIFVDEKGESQVQWRGNIRHVQGGDERRFSDFDRVTDFIQTKLAELTVEAMKNQSPEAQKGILAKSFDLWKRMATDYPKKMLETIADPKGQMEQLQEQIQEQVTQVGESVGKRLGIDEWRQVSKADYKNMMQMMESIAQSVEALNQKVDKLK